jgi:hypothetical protein
MVRPIALATLRFMKLELSWLLYRQFTWIGPTQNLVHVARCATIQVGKAGAICDQSSSFHKLPRSIDRGNPILCCEVRDH